ncbi:Ribosomal RNA small subunit methyltransferase A [Koleobacter methoxysyntrophicus]|jgi:16S rRNA (adenine1518-N6/adenine1519-N6)-dimethyltransferase|uniref:Ribosomal RNA small subunit methyltransferase A n=1 Tax=Koleobacter methoxysyntrophicus TaxID=2751313 RepID=A0A8A0RKX7_9FIRM|nr:16S rRNA (adenine(1518)-N(6)/adenine(1519)-N(6))-dimethyltransferase RsmA [Koleobacter methoxysyntrophicus]QSQ08542.1 Ribosomal RNA small subunit methyltransferase A [Koleobacter methoxysyntrophicus]
MDSLKLTSPGVINKIVREYNFRFSKGLGQNFLADENILNKIINSAMLVPGDRVLEIGAGIGTLTREISSRAEKVVAVEIDKDLIPILEENLKGRENIQIINGDILKLNLRELEKIYFGGKPFKVIANLPYYITTPIIMTLLEEGLNLQLMVFTLQKEVAERLTASPGTKAYGALTVAVNYYCHCEIISTVSRNVFFPKPGVDSAIIRLKMRQTPPVEVTDPELFFDIIKTVFKYRRKTLLNALSKDSSIIGKKNRLESFLLSTGINPARRGETLSIEEFARISNGIKGCQLF